MCSHKKGVSDREARRPGLQLGRLQRQHLDEGQGGGERCAGLLEVSGGRKRRKEVCTVAVKINQTIRPPQGPARSIRFAPVLTLDPSGCPDFIGWEGHEGIKGGAYSFPPLSLRARIT